MTHTVLEVPHDTHSTGGTFTAHTVLEVPHDHTQYWRYLMTHTVLEVGSYLSL